MQVTYPSNTLGLIFTIAVVLSIIIQAAVFVGLYVVVSTALKKLMKTVDEVKGKAMPIVGNVQSIIQDVSPKVKTVSGHIVEITETVRDQTKHVNSTVDDVVDKTKAQAAKVDDMVSAVLGSISHAGSTVQQGVAKPARKVSSVFHSIQVGLEALMSKKSREAAPGSTPYRRGAYPTGRAETVEEDFAATGAAESQTIHPPPTTSSPQ